QEKVVVPQPTVPQIFTLMGQYVRVAYNNQGFVTLGYKVAQESVGEDWLMLEVGMTMVAPTGSYRLKRGGLKLKTPDGTFIPLATQADYAGAGFLPSLRMKAKVMRDSINYFPGDVNMPCSLNFFVDMGQGHRQLAVDDLELSSNRGCVGRLFFKV